MKLGRDDLWFIIPFGLVIAFVVWLGIWAAKQTAIERKACEKDGGSYVSVRGSGMCFAPGVLLPLKAVKP